MCVEVHYKTGKEAPTTQYEDPPPRIAYVTYVDALRHPTLAPKR